MFNKETNLMAKILKTLSSQGKKKLFEIKNKQKIFEIKKKKKLFENKIKKNYLKIK